MANVQQIIVDAAERYKVPVEALLAIAKIESDFDPNAKNPNSSAGGVFQFTDKTAKAYGLTGDKRNDVAAQADAAARMVQTNSRALTKTLGRAPNAGELYLAHQQGLTGARVLLANPNQTAAQALSSIYGDRSASVVRQNGGNPNAKASQFSSQWVEKGNNTARMFPPGDLPTVGTLQDTRAPVVPPLPATAVPNLATMRANTSPTGGNSELQTALDRVATRERNRVTPASADDRVNARNRAWLAATSAEAPPVASMPSVPPPRATLTAPGGVDAVFGGLQQDSGLAAALAGRTAAPAPQAAQRVDRVAQAPTASQPMAPRDLLSSGVMGNMFDGLRNDPATAKGLASMLAPKVADLPQRGKSSVLDDYAYNRTQPLPQSKAAPRPIASPQRVAAASNTGGSNRDHFGSLIARMPSAPSLFAERDTIAPSSASIVATLPTMGIGQPPSTRAVQTTAVTPRPNSVVQERAEQNLQRQVAPPAPRTAAMPASAPRIDGIGAGASWAELNRTLGNPGRAKPSQVALNEDRLLPGLAYTGQSLPPVTPSPAFSVAHLSGQVNSDGKRIAVPFEVTPFPMPRPDFMPQVATALDVVPMPPLPIPRPGIGGQYGAVPMPAPRPQRPGLFRLGGFELPQLPTQARSVAGRTSMFDAPIRQVFNNGGAQNTSVIQSYRNEGLSPSQAYDAANRAATERAISNARDPAAAARLNSR